MARLVSAPQQSRTLGLGVAFLDFFLTAWLISHLRQGQGLLVMWPGTDSPDVCGDYTTGELHHLYEREIKLYQELPVDMVFYLDLHGSAVRKFDARLILLRLR